MRYAAVMMILLLAGCAGPRDSCGAPIHQAERVPAFGRERAIDIASKLASDQGYDVDRYATEAHLTEANDWVVFFDLKEPVDYVGGDSHFGVSVHSDGSTYLARGR